MTEQFEFAAGTIVGRSHRNAGRNNQDAWYCLQAPNCTVAIVCDGCGSGEQSEVGARLGAPLVAHSLLRALQAEPAERPTRKRTRAAAPKFTSPASEICPEVWDRARGDVLTQLQGLASSLGSNLSAVVARYFLFTVVGAVITPPTTTFFALGDGVIVVNGELIVLGPFSGNAPPYLAYALIENSLKNVEPERLSFQLVRSLPTEQLNSFLLGTDGVQELVLAANRRLPGKNEPVGPLCRFWQEDQYFQNPDALRRQLAGINREAVSLRASATGCSALHREPGLLHDDTTLIVGRRRDCGHKRSHEGGAS